MSKNVLDYRFFDDLKTFPWIKAIYLYGSRARGDHRSRSDIDIAVECPDATDEQWLHVLETIEDADTLLPIDVVRLDQLPDGTLKRNIEIDRVVVFQRGRIANDA